MKKKIFNSISFKVIALYILMSIITLSFVITIIFENQVDLISHNTVLKSEKQLAQLIDSMKKFTIEMTQGHLFSSQDEKEILAGFGDTVSMHYRDFIIFSEDHKVLYRSSPEVSLPETYKEDALRSLTAAAFSGRNYYMRIDDNNKIINFYIPLQEFQSGNTILFVTKNMESLTESLKDLYKQALYVVFVVFLFHGIFAAFLYRSVIYPINTLTKAAAGFSGGKADLRLPLADRNDEIGSLASTFNSMADSITADMDSLASEINTTKFIKHENQINSTRDDMTGLLNLNYLAERIDEGVKQAASGNMNLALLMLNIDNFKEINKIYGKQTGDIVVLETARTVDEHCGLSDISARLEGDQFAVFSSDPTLEYITDLAEKIRSSMEKKYIVTPDGKLSVTVSIGAAYLATVGKKSTKNSHDLFEAAKSALDRAKDAGKNRIQFNNQEA